MSEPIFIALDSDFDWNTIVVTEPKSKSFNKGQSKPQNQWVSSDVYVKGPNGEKRPIFIELTKQFFSGISGVWPFGTDKDSRRLETLEGFQISYPMTSIDTMDCPTTEEIKTRKALDNVVKITLNALKKFCNKPRSERSVPPATFNAYITAKSENDWSFAVKPIYDYTNTTDQQTGEKKKDTSRPQRAYLKFITWGKGGNILSTTCVYGPDDQVVNPLEYMWQPDKYVSGFGHPVVRWDGIFWGSHGQTGYGASARLHVTEMNFTPSEFNSMTSFRMLPSNNATPQEPESSLLPTPQESEPRMLAPNVAEQQESEDEDEYVLEY